MSSNHSDGPLSDEAANAVFDVLVEHAAASAAMREEFVYHQTRRLVGEFRFGGLLGFGGKFRRQTSRMPDGSWGLRWYVDCYPEDLEGPRGEDRRVAVAVTNDLLEGLRVAYTGASLAGSGGSVESGVSS